ncbi:MAG: hypothetical protein FWF23_01080 [Alphaproteobacteria bacterium]|nr:hypothetical protein [Alphaproteobacteria bacterium]MCL2504698.1 hypothetical protein [Alphaproteobacteria bacterium]
MKKGMTGKANLTQEQGIKIALVLLPLIIQALPEIIRILRPGFGPDLKAELLGKGLAREQKSTAPKAKAAAKLAV